MRNESEESAAEALLSSIRASHLTVIDADYSVSFKGGAFVACSDQLHFGVKLGHPGAMLQTLTPGQLVLAAPDGPGSLHRIDLQAGQEYLLDSARLVAWYSHDAQVPVIQPQPQSLDKVFQD